MLFRSIVAGIADKRLNNPVRPIDPAHILGEYDYAHPVFDLGAVAAQAQMPRLQGQGHCYYAGAWMGYGFHEDGLKAGLAAAAQLLADSEGRADRAAPAPPANARSAAAEMMA